jgi:amidase
VRVLDDLALRPAVELAAMVRERQVSSRELVELFLGRIEALDGELNAVVTVDAEGARRRADELDRATALVGPLHGVPMTIKDAFATAGLRTTAGMPERADHVPTRDAEAVARLRAAGVVVLGKTNVPEEVTGQETANVLFGRTVNPWDPTRTPGGSSGGAAVALATGMTPLELGSDSGGSIRQPAHCCGVFGHVATHGLVPLRGHLPTIEPDEPERDVALTAVGPMARSADDLDLAMEVLASAELPPPQAVERIAVLFGSGDHPLSREVRSRLEAAASAVGAEEASFPLSASADLAWRQWLGLEVDTSPVVAAWASLFERYDVVLCPISPVVAVPNDPDPGAVDSVEHRLARTIDVDGHAQPYLDQMVWNIVVGAAGLPATAAPLGGDPLPVGAQVVGPPMADRTTIAVSRRVAGRAARPSSPRTSRSR